LNALAPHQTEPPFIVAQVVVLAIFVVLDDLIGDLGHGSRLTDI